MTDAFEIVRQRFAKGEIDEQEYNRIIVVLAEADPLNEKYISSPKDQKQLKKWTKRPEILIPSVIILLVFLAFFGFLAYTQILIYRFKNW